MKNKMSASELKATAKEQLLGCYTIAIGSLVILIIISYGILSIVSGAISSLVLAGRTSGNTLDVEQLSLLMSDPKMSFLINILTYIVMAVVAPIMSIFSVGYTYVCREISYGRYPKTSDLFYGFKNHPDKIIIISLVVYAIELALRLPADIYSMNVGNDPSGQQFLAYVIMVVIFAIIMAFISIMLSQAYLVYLDKPEFGAIDCIKASIALMKGNKWRYFYLLVSFIGYGLLIVFSLGIAVLWIAPFYEVTAVNFYRNITGEDIGSEFGSGINED